MGLVIDGAPLKGPNTTFWPINKDGATIGKVTSAVYSPRLEQNIALAMVSADSACVGAEVEVVTGSGSARATIVDVRSTTPKETRCRLSASPKTGNTNMSDLSIDLHWQRAEPELQPGKYSNAHTVQYNDSYDDPGGRRP